MIALFSLTSVVSEVASPPYFLAIKISFLPPYLIGLRTTLFEAPLSDSVPLYLANAQGP